MNAPNQNQVAEMKAKLRNWTQEIDQTLARIRRRRAEEVQQHQQYLADLLSRRGLAADKLRQLQERSSDARQRMKDNRGGR
jgi:hypothetical protein